MPLHAPLEVGTALGAEVLDDPESLQDTQLHGQHLLN
jgi:hypothetical protein